MEQTFSYGPSDALTGILNQSRSSAAKNRPTVIILNAGLVHHVGPHRTTVELARAIESEGFNVFRFDLSAIGDSTPRKSRLGYQERAMQEIRETMDFLSHETKAKKFILSGLCTGADFAHRTAVADDRVIGCIFMDGYAYPTLQFHLLRIAKKTKILLRKIVSPERWVHLVQKIVHSPQKNLKQNNNDSSSSEFDWTLPPKSQSTKDYALLVNRNVNLFFIFTASEAKSLNYQKQVSDSFKPLNFGEALRVDIFPLSDHTFTFLSQRELMISNTCQWLTEKHPLK
jgi:pimeloyl-ACP methyl ester carboxylesterase